MILDNMLGSKNPELDTIDDTSKYNVINNNGNMVETKVANKCLTDGLHPTIYFVEIGFIIFDN